MGYNTHNDRLPADIYIPHPGQEMNRKQRRLAERRVRHGERLQFVPPFATARSA